MGLVYSYLRFSDPKQAAGSSAERQAAYAARWAAEHGLQLDDTLSLRDEGLSAYHQRHIKSGALGTFLAAVEQGRIVPGSVLVVEGLDRLSRAEPILAQAQLAQIINAGITVVTASDGKRYSRETLKAQPMDLVYSLLVMIRAHEESDTKSRRVSAAIARQCAGWLAGTYRGLIRNGKDPAWLRLVKTATGHHWELIPDRVAAVRLVLDLYREGWGPGEITRRLIEVGVSPTGGPPGDLMLYRVLRQPGLAGYKPLSAGGQSYLLPGYYPALLTETEWQQLQQLTADRAKRRVSVKLPGIITGLGIARCGYCGRAMVGQAYTTRKKGPDGRLADGSRRLLCTNRVGGCSVAGSMSCAPVERVLMRWCADKLNLQSLLAAPEGEGPRQRLLALRAELARVDEQIERLTDAMLADADAAPAAFARRVRALEDQRPGLLAKIRAAEADLSAHSRVAHDGIDEQWAALVDGVERLDPDARMQARRLVADTFAQIVVYHQGLEPPEKHSKVAPFSVLLVAKSGGSRILHARRDGTLIEAVDATDHFR